MKLKSSFVCLNDLHFHAYHGVMPQERVTGGDFVVSIRAGYPVAKAMESDNVGDTLNYAVMYDIIKEEMLKPSCLLENVAFRIGKSIFSRIPSVESIDITLSKLNPPMSGDIGNAAVELHLINNKTI